MKKLLMLLLAAWMFAHPGAFALETAQPSPPPAERSILDPDGLLALVNRKNRISKTYVPDPLVLPRVATRKASLQENIYLRPEAARALEAMFEAAFLEKAIRCMPLPATAVLASSKSCSTPRSRRWAAAKKPSSASRPLAAANTSWAW